MKLPSLVALLLAFVVVSAFAASAPVYFPLTPGAMWSWKGDDGSIIIMKVAGQKTVGSVTCAVVETGVMRQAGLRLTRICYEATPTEVRIIETEGPNRTVVLDPPRVILMVPPRAGKRWTWMPRDMSIGGQSTDEWIREETVKVTAGTFKAWKLKTATKREDVSVTVYVWYAPGVGIVKTWREERRAGQRRQGGTELISYRIP